MKSKPAARHAYVEAEVITGLAHQIKAIRMQRGWTQAQLAKRMKTTQAGISRLEDPSYGRYTIGTLIGLAKAFDTGMQVRFVSFVTMLHETFIPNTQKRQVSTFADECQSVDFYRTTPPSSLFNGKLLIDNQIDTAMRHLNIVIDSPNMKSTSIAVSI